MLLLTSQTKSEHAHFYLPDITLLNPCLTLLQDHVFFILEVGYKKLKIKFFFYYENYYRLRMLLFIIKKSFAYKVHLFELNLHEFLFR